MSAAPDAQAVLCYNAYLVFIDLFDQSMLLWQERPQIIAGSDSRSCNNAQEHQAKSVQGELLPAVPLFLQIACAIV